MTVTPFDLETLALWREPLEAASEAFPVPELSGWSLSGFDPAALVLATEGVQLAPAVKLITYVLRTGGGGVGVTWGLPAAAPVPPAEDCPIGAPPPWSWPSVDRVPRPPSLLAHPHEVVHLTAHTPENAVRASLLVRAWGELGAYRHGRAWSDHAILAALPTDDDSPAPEAWRWATQPPAELHPHVEATPDGALHVRFYSVSGYGGWQIYEHHDHWHPHYTRIGIGRVAQAPGGWNG
jgi:hypothetical protein